MGKIETYLDLHKVQYQRSENNDFIKYGLRDDASKKVNLQILSGINSNVGHYSIYVNNNGDYINYETYQNEEDFIKDIDNVLRAKVNLRVTVQGGKTIKNRYLFIYPDIVDIRPYQVVEYVRQGSLFKRKSHVEILLQPWIE